MAMDVVQVDSTREHGPKKRKAPSCHDGSDEDTGDDSKSVRTDDHKKQNHSEIEKRRRDKMNTYITELSAMVPMCHAMSRKLDKLTVLRMAVQHMKTIRGAVNSYTDGNYKPSFLSDLQLKQLIKQAAEGFLFVVGCDRGRILYVSESVSDALNYTQSDLLGQSWFDILHPKDVAKVKEQLSSSHLSPRERFIDAKTMLPVKTEVPQNGSRLSPGARRSFFCRMKCKSVTTTVKEEADTTTGCHRKKKQQGQGTTSDKKYRVIQCTGYLKPWATAKICLDDEKESESEGETSNLSCLVAMGRVMVIPFPHQRPIRAYHPPINVRPLQFISRHALDGKFLFVDQKATLVLGFLPQELLGTSMYEYYYKEDICHLAESHKAALQSKEPVNTKVYRFRSREGNYVQLQSEWKSFRNPWTKEGEYLVAKNSRLTTNVDSQVESSVERAESYNQAQGTYEYYGNKNNGNEISGRDMPKFITSNFEASNIGRQIAEEVIDEQRRALDSPARTNNSTPSPSHLQSTTEVGLKFSLAPSDISLPTLGLYNDYGTSDELQPVISPERNGIPPEINKNLVQRIIESKTICTDENYPGKRNDVTLSSLGSDTDARALTTLKELLLYAGAEGDEMMEMIGSAVSPQQVAPSDGNDEAAMAVIMSLLEADAGLGGPVDFTGLPWPLP
uniref:Cycle n=1 Tax=Pyrrhocoris apterus TaxID=37000 RepID=A0A8K1ZRI5_PYRAP|nr:cycle [Pyrrhocoris apterus]